MSATEILKAAKVLCEEARKSIYVCEDDGIGLIIADLETMVTTAEHRERDDLIMKGK